MTLETQQTYTHNEQATSKHKSLKKRHENNKKHSTHHKQTLTYNNNLATTKPLWNKKKRQIEQHSHTYVRKHIIRQSGVWHSSPGFFVQHSWPLGLRAAFLAFGVSHSAIFHKKLTVCNKNPKNAQERPEGQTYSGSTFRKHIKKANSAIWFFIKTRYLFFSFLVRPRGVFGKHRLLLTKKKNVFQNTVNKF